MTKEETIAIYEPQYLAGKPEDFCLKFQAKTLMQKYNTIMGWRRKQKLEEQKNVNSEAIVSALQEVRKLIKNLTTLSGNDVRAFQDEIAAIELTIEDKSNELRNAEIASLEEEQRKIAARLEQLRNI